MTTIDRYELIRTEENDIKPNILVANGLLIVGLFGLLIWMINEAGIFNVDKNSMRVVGFAVLVIISVAQVIRSNSTLVANKYSKYVIMLCCIAMSFVTLSILYIWGYMLILLPLFFSLAYSNRSVYWLSYAGSVLTALVSPIIGLVKGWWSLSYLETILIMLGVSFKVNGTQMLDSADVVLFGLTRIGIPNTILLTGFFLFGLRYRMLRADNAETRVRMTILEEKDPITGLYNRISLKKRLEQNVFDNNAKYTFVYADMHGLCDTNSREGYDAGDEMLESVAAEFRETFGEENSYRISAGRFLAILSEDYSHDIGFDVEKIRKRIRQMGYVRWSIGVYDVPEGMQLRAAVFEAEKRMQSDRAAYYSIEKNDRRRNG